MSEQVCPKTWMAESILVTVFCCLPFGIAGIVFASKVSSLYAQVIMKLLFRPVKMPGSGRRLASLWGWL